MGKIYLNNIEYAGGVGGGSSSHEYSTTEKVIGTWIDGSDVYEKTYVINSIGSGSTYAVDNNFTGNIVQYGGIAMSPSNASRYGIPDGRMRLWVTDSNVLTFEAINGGTFQNYKLILIVAYTKA